MIDRVSISQDDNGDWWLQFYNDDIRYGISVADILEWQEGQTTYVTSGLCPYCGQPLLETETILPNGELGCQCRISG